MRSTTLLLALALTACKKDSDLSETALGDSGPTDTGYDVVSELYALSSDIHYVSIDGAWYDLTFIQESEGADSQYIRNRAFVATRSDEARIVGEGRRTPSKAQVERWLLQARLNPNLAVVSLLRRPIRHPMSASPHSATSP